MFWGFFSTVEAHFCCFWQKWHCAPVSLSFQTSGWVRSYPLLNPGWFPDSLLACVSSAPLTRHNGSQPQVCPPVTRTRPGEAAVRGFQRVMSWRAWSVCWPQYCLRFRGLKLTLGDWSEPWMPPERPQTAQLLLLGSEWCRLVSSGWSCLSPEAQRCRYLKLLHEEALLICSFLAVPPSVTKLECEEWQQAGYRRTNCLSVRP